MYMLCTLKALYLNVRSLEDHILYDSNLYEMYKIGKSRHRKQNKGVSPELMKMS